VSAQRHQIQRQIFDIAVPNQALGKRLHDELSRLQQQSIETIIDQCCSGNGGSLTLTCNGCPELRSWLDDKLAVRSYGGNSGLGGEGGFGGLAGLVSSGNSAQDGDQGPKGQTGKSGEPGKNGAINFEQNN
jgi:hypothetical protein